jgi:hypothetical protein
MFRGWEWLKWTLYQFPYSTAAMVVATVFMVLVLGRLGKDFRRKSRRDKLRYVSYVLAGAMMLGWFVFTRAAVPVTGFVESIPGFTTIAMMVMSLGFSLAFVLFVVSVVMKPRREDITTLHENANP